MARLFFRRYAPAFWNRAALEGPRKGLTLREWEVCVILCSLPPAVRRALLAWLIAPTDRRWLTPSGAGACGPFGERPLREPGSRILGCASWAASRGPTFSAAPRAPAPDTFSRRRSPFAPGDLRQPVKPLPTLLFDEIKAVRQTLDMSLDSLHGITRDLLLVAHGTRLRQIIGALGEARALQEIEALLRLARQGQRRRAPFLSTRWGGRWAWFFGAS